MPKKPQKPCAHPFCNRLVDSGYCDEHNRHKLYNRDRQHDDETAFYRSSDWRKTSEQYRGMFPACEVCGAKAKMVHHNPPVTTLIEQGKDPCDWEYLHSLCWRCHAGVGEGGKSFQL